MIGIGLVIFCLVIIATVFKGKIAAGIQKSEPEGLMVMTMIMMMTMIHTRIGWTPMIVEE